MDEENTVDSEVNSDISQAAYDHYFDSAGEVTQDVSKESAENQAEEQTDPDPETQAVDDESEKPNSDHVPLASFMKEKNRRREIARKMERMEETFQQVLEKLEQKHTAQEPPPPTYEEDPIGSLAHNQKVLKTQLQQQQQALSDRNQQDQQRQAYETLVHQYRVSANDFQSQQADFPAAYQFLVDSKIAEYTTIGLSREDAERRLQTEELGVAQLAFKEGSNPAEIIYKLAKARGYQRNNELPGQSQEEAQQAASKLQNLKQGLKANRSLSATGGKTRKRMTLERLSEMDASDPDFDKYWGELIGKD